ncbi:MAG: sugar phosphate isomerase/epimerase [Tissierellia bacterium]|nr:sugar phosphate isomerase/epimerase [Tissierellia bacterium]
MELFREKIMGRKILIAVSHMGELNIDQIKALNLGVELQDFVEPNLSLVDRNRIIGDYKVLLKDFNNIKALHGPFLDLKPASPDKDIREISYKKYLYTIKAARELDIDYLIFHSQINPYLNEPRLRKLNNMQAKEFWLKILDEVPDYKGTILLENIFEETPTMLGELIDTIALPKIKINLDIGHAKLGTASLEDWIRELGDYIEYIHIHSNDGQYDLHQSPIIEEIVDLYYLVDKYNLNPILSLEYKIENLKEEIRKYR